MDMHTIWPWVLFVASTVTGVVTFAIQVRQVKQVRLANEKLQLEIEALKVERDERGRLVQVATTEEVLALRQARTHDHIAYARTGGVNPGDDGGPQRTPPSPIVEVMVNAALLLLLLAFLGYLAYDLYRITMWVVSLF